MHGERPAFLSSYGQQSRAQPPPHQQQLVDELLPQLEISLPPARGRGRVGVSGGPARRSIASRNSADPHPTLPLAGEGYDHIALEIGFGAGEHLLAQAVHRRDTLFVAASRSSTASPSCSPASRSMA
ncbi:MAG: hypothetical protein WDN72_05420 [Alphaproteobacteria bacterium]